MEHEDSTSLAKAADGACDVAEYTNYHGLYYSDLTTMEDEWVCDHPTNWADSVRAHYNRLMWPSDGEEPGPGVETGTGMDKPYVWGLTVPWESILHKHATEGDG